MATITDKRQGADSLIPAVATNLSVLAISLVSPAPLTLGGDQAPSAVYLSEPAPTGKIVYVATSAGKRSQPSFLSSL